MNRAVAIGAVLVGVAGEGVAIAASSAGSARWNEAAFALVPVAYGTVGLVIVWHRPRHPVGRIAVALAPAWGLGEALVATSYAVLRDRPTHSPALLASVAGGVLRALPWLLAVVWLPLRFPDGRAAHPTRLLRVSERVAVTAVATFATVALFSPHLTDLRLGTLSSPVGAPGLLGDFIGGPLAALNLVLGIVAIGLAVACLVQRYRRGGALDRQQTLIFGLAFVPPVAALLASSTNDAGPWLFTVATLPLPVAIGVAVLQRRLYDIPLAVNRSLTYGALWLVIAGLYAVTVGGVGAMVRQRGAAWLPWLAAGVVAVSFAPLRDALQRAANRITYGQWSQPAEVLSRTGRSLADAGDLHALLMTLAQELGEGLRLGYVEIVDSSGTLLASHGSSGEPLEELPLTAYGSRVGALRWARRPLRDSDRRLLGDLANQLGTVVRADRLLASVRAAQERLVLAREEERKRLRRDLHDGLGPALAGLTLQVDTLRNQLADAAADAAADEGLLRLRTGIHDTVLDVRRIVEGLRPPTLDDLGLVESLRQLAGRLGGGLEVRVESDDLPRLPAAVEVGAYRIAQEALTNAVRHSGGSRADVCLRLVDEDLEVIVADNGSGQLQPRDDGLGLASMRERAEEIGGTFALVPVAGTGTVVRARLPLTRVAVR